MMKKYIFFGPLGFILMAFIFASCEKESIHNPIINSSSIPDPVSNVRVKNLHGGAKISYNIPPNDNILSVKAVVQKKNGTKEVRKSSQYKSYIVLNGFADTTIYHVKLYSVNLANNESKPVKVKIKPLTPPILYVFNSLKLSKGFGGVKVTFKNIYKGNVKIAVITNDSLGNLNVVDAYYTKQKKDPFLYMVILPKKRRFGVYVRDQWGNRSDTVYKDITPLFEQEIPKSGFSAVHLPTDTWKQSPCCHAHFSALWDGIVHTSNNSFVTQRGTPFPQWFTIDLGVKAKLDRFKVYSYYWPTSAGGAYTASDPKVIILWGSNHPDTKTGSFKGWIKLGKFVATKPSGSPPGQFTKEDIELACQTGRQFVIPDAAEKPAVRYIRFETVDTWTASHANGVALDELTFWGDIVKKF